MIEGAPMTLEQAKQLIEEGALVQALHYSAVYVTVVVKQAAVAAPRTKGPAPAHKECGLERARTQIRSVLPLAVPHGTR